MKKMCAVLLVALLSAFSSGVASANTVFEVKKVVFDKKTGAFDLWVNRDGVSFYRLSPGFKLVILKKNYAKNKSLVTIDFGCKTKPLDGNAFILSAPDLKRIDMRMLVVNEEKR
ncbi:hypothetical protein L6270_03085 [Candidatus Parcubacteria bacterium]|nr:hypothetical protein [Patescibacteria group bacterium]MBU4308946.1 hypothetical protein [Patescibacteria group bacterium]MBU4431883.1 hypothetical protein [Patescibacteria group bacterium]MBU4577306.1 hypothetical protein [Patescibacteria group bacterium]MCG2696996.1 hypothetical protein [Candidatus Parcubacteria bacterium]